jgi:Domain of unknown function (DUF4123)
MSDGRTSVTPLRGPATPLLPLLLANRAMGPGHLFMLLDAARDPRIYTRLTELGGAIQAGSLYQGDIGDNLAHVYPFLVALRQDHPESLKLAEGGFGRSWGLFVTASIEFDDLRRHLRKFNVVYREDGTPLIFRFYDPRVMRAFLPTCTQSELRRFFGPIESFLVESEKADALIRFMLRGGELMQSPLPVRV